MQYIRKQSAKELVDRMYRAAFSALCHCDNNPEGAFPKDCPCEQTKNTSEAISMLLSERNGLIKIIENAND